MQIRYWERTKAMVVVGLEKEREKTMRRQDGDKESGMDEEL